MRSTAHAVDAAADGLGVPDAERDAEACSLTRDQLVAELDEVIGQRTGRPALDVLGDYRAGRLRDPGQIGDALIFAALLDSDDPYSAR